MPEEKPKRPFGRPFAPGNPGRPKGTPNRVTADVKALAQSFGRDAILRLALLAGLTVDENGNALPGAENEATQVAAVKELLDRGFGKVMQPVGGEASDGSIVIKVVKFAGDNAPE